MTQIDAAPSTGVYHSYDAGVCTLPEGYRICLLQLYPSIKCYTLYRKQCYTVTNHVACKDMDNVVHLEGLCYGPLSVNLRLFVTEDSMLAFQSAEDEEKDYLTKPARYFVKGGDGNLNEVKSQSFCYFDFNEVLSITKPGKSEYEPPTEIAMFVVKQVYYKNPLDVNQWPVFKHFEVFFDVMLGKGGNGEVYLGMHRSSGRLVALKRENGDMLLNEYYFLLRCKHAHTVKPYCYYPNQGKHDYIVLEYLAGGTVRELLKSRAKKLPMKAVKKFFFEIMLAIENMHLKGVMHRDIKTNNLMLNTNDKTPNLLSEASIKIVDFGNGYEMTSRDSLIQQNSTTCFSCAPEILHCLEGSNEGYNEKADIWAAGTVFYELITSRRLFDAPTLEEVYPLVESFECERLDEILEGFCCPQGVDLLRACLMKDQSKRISASEALKHPFFDSLKEGGEDLLTNPIETHKAKKFVSGSANINKGEILSTYREVKMTGSRCKEVENPIQAFAFAENQSCRNVGISIPAHPCPSYIPYNHLSNSQISHTQTDSQLAYPTLLEQRRSTHGSSFSSNTHCSLERALQLSSDPQHHSQSLRSSTVYVGGLSDVDLLAKKSASIVLPDSNYFEQLCMLNLTHTTGRDLEVFRGRHKQKKKCASGCFTGSISKPNTATVCVPYTIGFRGGSKHLCVCKSILEGCTDKLQEETADTHVKAANNAKAADSQRQHLADFGVMKEKGGRYPLVCEEQWFATQEPSSALQPTAAYAHTQLPKDNTQSSTHTDSIISSHNNTQKEDKGRSDAERKLSDFGLKELARMMKFRYSREAEAYKSKSWTKGGSFTSHARKEGCSYHANKCWLKHLLEGRGGSHHSSCSCSSLESSSASQLRDNTGKLDFTSISKSEGSYNRHTDAPASVRSGEGACVEGGLPIPCFSIPLPCLRGKS